MTCKIQANNWCALNGTWLSTFAVLVGVEHSYPLADGLCGSLVVPRDHNHPDPRFLTCLDWEFHLGTRRVQHAHHTHKCHLTLKGKVNSIQWFPKSGIQQQTKGLVFIGVGYTCRNESKCMIMVRSKHKTVRPLISWRFPSSFRWVNFSTLQSLQIHCVCTVCQLQDLWYFCGFHQHITLPPYTPHIARSSWGPQSSFPPWAQVYPP